ncbi:MAG: hypothetical protein U9N79_08310 [Actinomycetota bacterium]|nr:hypothetical protein [Actinomycetota bacterium]
MPVIQRQLGHVHPTSTDRYLSRIAPKAVLDTMNQGAWDPHGAMGDD